MFAKPRKPVVVGSRDIIKDNKRSIITFKPTSERTRLVPAFSAQTLQKNTVAKPLPHKEAERKPPARTNIFYQMYDGGNLPVRLDHISRGWQLQWTQPIESLDYEFYLPRFFEGLSVTRSPYQFIAEKGVNDLLDNCTDSIKILSNLPFLIGPLRLALAIDEPSKRRALLGILEKLARVPMCGPALIPYYRQLLSPLRRVEQKAPGLGGASGLGAKREGGVKGSERWTTQTLEDATEKVLHTLEKMGGPNAYINIKYVIPAYVSCMGNR
uniref:Uncharacterized protein n=1 Tax=Plectus sambesii TaxID=2011161 RepID=A0A914V5B1_9BILA